MALSLVPYHSVWIAVGRSLSRIVALTTTSNGGSLYWRFAVQAFLMSSGSLTCTDLTEYSFASRVSRGINSNVIADRCWVRGYMPLYCRERIKGRMQKRRN